MEPVVNAVFPVFAIIFCGYLAERMRLLGGESSEAPNRFAFYVAFPVLLFHAIALAELEEIFNWRFIGGFVSSALVTLLAAMAVSGVVFQNGLGESALFGMSSAFGNTVYMGIPLAIIIFGETALLPAVIASVFQGVVLIVIAVVSLESDHQA